MPGHVVEAALGLDPLGDVLLDHHEVVDAGLPVDQRLDGLIDGVEVAVLVPADDLAAPDVVHRQPLPVARIPAVAGAAGVQQRRSAAEELGLFVAAEPAERPIHPLDRAVVAADQDGAGGRVHGGALQAQDALDPAPHGDVAVDPEDADLPAVLEDRIAQDPHLDGLAVLAPASGLSGHDLAAHHPPRELAGARGLVVGDDERVDRPAARLLAGVAEDALERAVDLDDPIVRAQQDDGVRRVVEQLAEVEIVETWAGGRAGGSISIGGQVHWRQLHARDQCRRRPRGSQDSRRRGCLICNR